MAIKIAVDAGHYNYDSGAVYAGIREVDINRSVVLKLIPILKAHGFSVKEVFGSVTAKKNSANSWGAQVYVSVHQNAHTDPSAHGTEVWYYPKTAQDKRLARLINQEVAKAFPLLRNRGIKQGTYTVIKYTKAHAALLEWGFLSNTGDRSIITSASGKHRCAESIARAVCLFIGISYKGPDTTFITPPAIPVPEPEPEPEPVTVAPPSDTSFVGLFRHIVSSLKAIIRLIEDFLKGR